MGVGLGVGGDYKQKRNEKETDFLFCARTSYTPLFSDKK